MTESLAAALAAVQAELPKVAKTKTADTGSYKYKYADLADVTAALLPVLAKHGLSFSSKPTIDESGRFVLAYVLRHISGDSDTGSYPLPTNARPQEIGSAVTYARRYALCALTGLAAEEDDDGKAAGETKVDATDRTYAWDPVEQEVLLTAWSDEIAKADTTEEITKIGQQILAGKQKGELSPNTYRKLANAGSARKAELNGKVKTPEAAK